MSDVNDNIEENEIQEKIEDLIDDRYLLLGEDEV
jgi:hypothetical protein